MEFWEWLAAEIKRQETTKHATARKAGLPHNTVQEIIRNKRYPRVDTAEKLQQALGTRYPGEDADAPEPEPLMTAEKVEEYRAKDIQTILAGNPALGPADVEAIMLIVEGKEKQLREAEKKKGKPKKGR